MSSLAEDAVNSKGLPADTSKTGGWLSAAFILGVEVSERFSSYGITVGLVTYLVDTMHLSSASSSKIVTNFVGTCYLLSLFGGFCADSFLGRYWTILVFSIVLALGTGMLAICTALPHLHPPPCQDTLTHKCKPADGYQMGFLYASLYLTSLGVGGVKSSVSGFGTDQFNEKDEKEMIQMAFFFNRFYLIISIGTLLAVTVLVYIEEKVDRGWGYAIIPISISLALFAFLSRTRRYRYKKCSGSPLVQIIQVVVAALRKTSLDPLSNSNYLYEEVSAQAMGISRTAQFLCLDKAAIVAEGDYKKDGGTSTPNPWRLKTVMQVEEVKMVVRLLPVWTTTIIFWTIHAQIITFSVQQAYTMERMVGKFQIPAPSFTVFFVASILITGTINDRLIMPLWKKWKGKQGFTNLQRIAIGLALSILGMVAASLVEHKRSLVARSVHAPITTTLHISAFMLLPQHILVGAGEAFMYTGQLDFFLTQSPKGMKAMSTALFLTTIALGFFVSSFLVVVVKKVTGRNGGREWLADSINEGRLDLFYMLLAVLSFINLAFYLLSATWYKISKRKHCAKEIVVNV